MRFVTSRITRSALCDDNCVRVRVRVSGCVGGGVPASRILRSTVAWALRVLFHISSCI